ncbi:DUF427 domain-containing protein [Mangrovivirga sp. M17]|uniref:DUF427 domain-containing protein n=1 Tax=Mangrovivirga halotolerans TaxID=2993936 RepID=A0ABT3RR21_9BACT|nr:DUF427 domain-containing protein [Mangrovivirga halotolerans]MCX2743946.1 DUF427 domain-containing protein [Mangrovivirga halotolerans]
MKAVWKGKVIAKSDNTKVVEGNHYFPPSSVNDEYLAESYTTSKCPWKGTAHYYNINVEGNTNEDAAWYYPDPKDAASDIKDYVAFWNGVEITD